MSLTPTQKEHVRSAISHYCLTAEQNRLKWYYAMQRPFRGYGVRPDLYHVADCSAYCSLVFNWAMHQAGVYLHDPLDEAYSGYGYTGTQYDYLRHHTAPVDKYLVGDMAIFGQTYNTVHTSVCRKAGDTRTAVFSSNGHQSWVFYQDAPEPISLSHAQAQQHLVGVYRHPALL